MLNEQNLAHLALNVYIHTSANKTSRHTRIVRKTSFILGNVIVKAVRCPQSFIEEIIFRTRHALFE